MNEILAFPPELLTKKHVAYMLSTSERGVAQLVSEKKLIPVNDGGKWLKFRLTDVRDYIARLPERRVVPNGE
jgi:hypothetical protein